MKKVLILGAGLVSRPMVRYLLDKGFSVTVATRTVSKAEALIAGHPNGRAARVLVDDQDALRALVADADLAVSLLPATHHVKVARLCLELGKPMVTTSYISPQMKALDQEAKDKGVLLLNECGVDPGIDHMSAMRVIDAVRAKGGKIDSFVSWCGGLPAPEANDNPWLYKFSWSPRGVLVAAMSPARWIEGGEERTVEAGTLFENYRMVEVPGAGAFEGYPNRDSTGYIEAYGLDGIETMLRGTLRYPGHCGRWQHLVRLGLMDASEQVPGGLTYAGLLRRKVGGRGTVEQATARFLGLDMDSPDMGAMRWLGLFSDEPIPVEGAAIDVLADLMARRMPFGEGERDMLVMKHEFVASYPDGKQETLFATMVDYGIPGGDSSMARTVSLPSAIAVRMILEGEVELVGVHRPVLPELYGPILSELEELGITVEETSQG